MDNACRMRGFHFIQPPSSSVCPPQPRTPKSCFCTVWRKPTTSSRCSSLTQGCHHCPTAQRSKFRCASARRTRCTAVRPTPTASAYSCCSRHSCSPYSVSTIKTATWKQWEVEVMFYLLTSLWMNVFFALILQKYVFCYFTFLQIFFSRPASGTPQEVKLEFTLNISFKPLALAWIIQPPPFTTWT